jgi:hypothetical protein
MQEQSDFQLGHTQVIPGSGQVDWIELQPGFSFDEHSALDHTIGAEQAEGYALIDHLIRHFAFDLQPDPTKEHAKRMDVDLLEEAETQIGVCLEEGTEDGVCELIVLQIRFCHVTLTWLVVADMMPRRFARSVTDRLRSPSIELGPEKTFAWCPGEGRLFSHA